MGDYAAAITMYVPTADMFTSNSRMAIVIHKTAGFHTAQQCAQYFISQSPGPSAHYILGLDGTIIQCVPESLGAGANCCLETGHDPYWDQFNGDNLNMHTISIEHIDPATDNSTPPPQAQLDASFKLVAYLCKKYGIPVSSIKTHASLDPISRARCPGNYPMQQLLAYVQVQIQEFPGMEQQQQDTWNIFLASMFKPLAPYNTGIAAAWRGQYAHHNFGSPLGPEFDSVDWQQHPIRVQLFSGGIRCEWPNPGGPAKFYDANNTLIYAGY